MNTHQKSPFQYAGGKTTMLSLILQNIPTHKHYVEPYCGSAVVFFNKPPAKLNTLNDKDEYIVNFFRVLQKEETRKKLLRRLNYTIWSRSEYRLAYETYHNPEADEVEKAWSFFILQNLSMTKSARMTKSGNFGYDRAPSAKSAGTFRRRIEALVSFANKLKDIQLECDDGINVIRRYDDKETLMLVDPPYPLSTLLNANKNYYVLNPDENYHKELLQVLSGVQSMIILCSYPNALYDEYLLSKGWKRIDKEKPVRLVCKTRQFLNKNNGKYKPEHHRLESIYLNPNLLQKLEAEKTHLQEGIFLSTPKHH